MYNPRVCLVDIEEQIEEKLTKNNFIVSSGTLGKEIILSNKSSGDKELCSPNFDFPYNILEYDIFVVDLKGREAIKLEDMPKNENLSKYQENYLYLCQYPQNLFDPIPIGAKYLKNKLDVISKKKSLCIIFQESIDEIDYFLVKRVPDTSYLTRVENFTLKNFIILNSELSIRNQIGTKFLFDKDLSPGWKNFLQKYIPEFTSLNKFSYPTYANKNYFPLLRNEYGDLVSFIYSDNNLLFLVLPQIKDKSELLLDLLFNKFPSISPEIFPNLTKNHWLTSKEYFLPNYENLLKKKDQIEKSYKEELGILDNEINANDAEFKYLHHLITETDDDLVEAVKKFLLYLGFKDVINVDDVSEGLLEEDLRVELEKGLLVIEVKGISGTSTDSDCSQINKIKYRRAKERNKFDVYGLYIVNHQRHLPPLERQNPPFQPHQIIDAKNE